MTPSSRPRGPAPRPRTVGALAFAAALALTACGGADEPDAAPAAPVGPASTDSAGAPDPVEVLRVGRADRTEAPTQLEVVDLVVGEGDEAVTGSRVTVQYLGVRWSDGGVFDASWTRGQPFVFDLGAGQVIPGWERGVAGMRVGGRRILVIPPQLAYGDRGAGSVIGPGETLVFAVDLVEVAAG